MNAEYRSVFRVKTGIPRAGGSRYKPGSLQRLRRVHTTGRLLLRICNAEGDDKTFRPDLHFGFTQAQEVTLNGEAVKQGIFVKRKPKRNSIELAMPRFGFSTVGVKTIYLVSRLSAAVTNLPHSSTLGCFPFPSLTRRNFNELISMPSARIKPFLLRLSKS